MGNFFQHCDNFICVHVITSEAFRSLIMSMSVKGAIAFFSFVVDFFLTLENLLVIFKSENASGSSVYNHLHYNTDDIHSRWPV